MDHFLEINNLSVRYGDLTVVNQVSCSLNEGEWLMIIGPNGAGKSTILNAVSRGVSYDGEILFKGRNIREYKATALARHMGVLSQNHMVGYDFTVTEVVRLGRYAYRKGVLKGNSEDDQAAVEAAIQATGLQDLAQKSILHLSGGEVQRTFLAQLFAQQPDIMILDEPANHLDLVYQKQVFDLIKEWVKQPGRAVISVVHDLSMARAYGSHGLLLNKGQRIGFGPIEQVLEPEVLNQVYEMNVREWMKRMLGQWE